ncbi:hypothetical protein U1Q18_002101 [Sarracenia purpurea var. burkii]
MKEQRKADISAVHFVTPRWSPTPEQLLALKEMYQRGTRTPTTEQIQQIAGKLRRFGKIEGKNVFYWFQNHKARERQRRRRMLESSASDQEPQRENVETLERKESGLVNTIGFEIPVTKNKASSSNGSTLAEESVSIHRAVISVRGTDEWIEYEEGKLQQLKKRTSTETKNSTWQPIKPSPPPPPPPPPVPSINAAVTASAFGTIMDPKPAAAATDLEDERRETRTLQLFPIWSGDDRRVVHKSSVEVPAMKGVDTSFKVNQCFEFLPVKK